MKVESDKGIEIQGLSWAYGPRIALHAIELSIRPGRVTALLGPNGAGKTTLVSLLSGLMPAAPGSISICGYDISKRRRSALAVMGFVFQQQTLDLDLTVRQNMAYFAAIRGIPRRQARAGIQAGLRRMGLADRSDERVGSLNGGHRRRLEIARALIHAPEVLVLDEPTTGLDVPSRASLIDHVHTLCAGDGLTVLWTTHLVDEVWEQDDLIVLHNGRVKAAGPVKAVLVESDANSVLGAFNHLTSGRESVGVAGREAV